MLRELKRRFKVGRWDPGAEVVKIAKPRLAIEAVVENGVVKAVRCRAEVDVDVEITFIGVPEETAEERSAKGVEELKAEQLRVGPTVEETAGEGLKAAELKAAAECEAYLEELRREFGKLPVYIGVEDGLIYVKLMGRVDDRQFKRYVQTCRRLGFKFKDGRWVKRLD